MKPSADQVLAVRDWINASRPDDAQFPACILVSIKPAQVDSSIHRFIVRELSGHYFTVNELAFQSMALETVKSEDAVAGVHVVTRA